MRSHSDLGGSSMGTKATRVLAVGAAVFAIAHVGSASGAAGDLDPTFGTGGKVTTDFGNVESVHAVVLRRDGGIVAAGLSGQSGLSEDFALAAYTSRGALDQDFGVGGRVRTDLGGSFERANAAAAYPDGGIVVAGTTDAGGVLRFAVVKYERDGSLDESFGDGGVVLTQIPGSTNDDAADVVVQHHGKILVAGTSNLGDVALARFEANGDLDTRFGTDGIVTLDLGSAEGANALDLQPNGKIVVAGFGEGPSSVDFLVARFERDGQLDQSFGDGGVVLTDAGEFEVATDLVVRPHGRVVVAGASAGDVVLFALERDGEVDDRFGDAGFVRTDLGSAGDSAAAIALGHGGRLVVAGSTMAGSSADFAVIRYERDGTLDADFGSGGVVTTDLGSSTQDFASDVAVEPAGSIVVAGTFDVGATFDFAVVRYRPR